MGGVIAVLGNFDRVCGEFATALHNSEPRIYVVLALLLLIGSLLFPPKDDPDQA